MSKSSEHLMEAFAGESQANRKYLAFAKKADDEGFYQVAKLFRAAAEAETVHAHNHLRLVGGIKKTAENVGEAVDGETFEFMKMYPGFISDAKKEGNEQAAWSFDVANKVERIHAGLYKKALEALKNNKDIAITDFWVCKVCGNTVENLPPEKCPVCGAAKSAFSKVN